MDQNILNERIANLELAITAITQTTSFTHKPNHIKKLIIELPGKIKNACLSHENLFIMPIIPKDYRPDSNHLINIDTGSPEQLIGTAKSVWLALKESGFSAELSCNDPKFGTCNTGFNMIIHFD